MPYKAHKAMNDLEVDKILASLPQGEWLPARILDADHQEIVSGYVCIGDNNEWTFLPAEGTLAEGVVKAATKVQLGKRAPIPILEPRQWILPTEFNFKIGNP